MWGGTEQSVAPSLTFKWWISTVHLSTLGPTKKPNRPKSTLVIRYLGKPSGGAIVNWFFSEFSGCIRGGMKVDFLIIRDANQGACESAAFADSEMIRLTRIIHVGRTKFA